MEVEPVVTVASGGSRIERLFINVQNGQPLPPRNIAQMITVREHCPGITEELRLAMTQNFWEFQCFRKNSRKPFVFGFGYGQNVGAKCRAGPPNPKLNFLEAEHGEGAFLHDRRVATTC